MRPHPLSLVGILKSRSLAGQGGHVETTGEEAGGFGEGARAVADVALDFVGQLAESLRVAFGHEQGVVAEAARAARLARDAPLTDALERVDLAGRGVCDRDDADEACAPLLVARGLKLSEEFAHAFGVGRLRAGVARRVDPGPAAERVHDEAGVVRER